MQETIKKVWISSYLYRRSAKKVNKIKRKRQGADPVIDETWKISTYLNCSETYEKIN